MNEETTGQELSAQGAARRRFTRAGAAASGVLLTLHSQPGMAATACASPSGFLSGQLSARNPDPGSCTGLGPDYWSQGGTSWPAGTSRGTKFSNVFTCTGTMGSTYGASNCSLNSIMKDSPSFDQNGLGKYLAAAYLNVKSGRTGFQTEAMLTNIWNEWRDNNYFVPTAGVKWYSYEIVQYLKSTMQ